MGELTKILLGGSIVGACSVLFGAKGAKVYKPSFHTDSRLPVVFISTHSLIAATIINCLLLIFCVLPMTTFSQVKTAIIESVVIFVVTLLSINTSENEPMHFDSDCSIPLSDTSTCIKTSRRLVPYGTPIPLANPFIVGSIHDGVLTLRKFNQAVRIIKRLKGDMASDLVESTFVAHWSS